MASQVYELLVYENAVLRNYAFWSSILVMKMLLMTLVTAAQRIRTKVGEIGAGEQIIFFFTCDIQVFCV